MHIDLNKFSAVKSNKLHNKLFNDNDNGIILVHANWCGHCIQFKPEWSKFTAKFKKSDNLIVTEIESDSFNKLQSENQDLYNRIAKDVNGFPSILTVKNGKVEKYLNERTSNALEEHVKTTFNQKHQDGGAKKKTKPVKKTSATTKKASSKKGGDNMLTDDKFEKLLRKIVEDALAKKKK